MEYIDAIDAVLAVVLSVIAVASVGRLSANAPRRFADAVRTGLILHLVGATARYVVNTMVYGTGDSFRYFRAGNEISSALWSGDFAAIFSTERLWGTAFVDRVSGLLQVLLGQNFLVESLVFTLLGYGGLVLMAHTLARAHPRGQKWSRGVALILYWPSLCFWPSTIGKEALVLFAVGLVISGWYGNGRSIAINRLIAGVGLAILIRPHIAMMLAVALASAEWLGPVKRWGGQTMLRASLLLVMAAAAVANSLDRLGVESDLDAVAEFVEERAERTQTGGSRIDVVSGPAAIPMAFVNVLFRPFVWEARNPVMLISAVEMVALWWMISRQRRAGLSLLVRWRESRLLLFAVPAAIMLIVFYGAFVSNLGILARQRVVVLPLFFMCIELTPALVRATHASAAKR
jgi:hypothetical protein